MKRIIIYVICLLLMGLTCANAATKPFHYNTSEGFNLTGTLYIPNNTSQKIPLVVLLHSIGGNKSQWGNLPNVLIQKNCACLALDLRGHGGSVFNRAEKRCSWMYFTDRDFAKYPTDVSGAIQATLQSYKILNHSQIILVGSDLGANTAILAANKLNRKTPCVRSLVLISPRVLLKSLYTPYEMVKYGNHPVLIFCNKNVPKDYEDAKETKRHCEGPCTFHALDTTGMAATLYQNNAFVQTEIIKWIETIK